MNFQDNREKEMVLLLKRAKKRLPKLKKLLEEASSHWGYEDPIYRFYHHSFKVYHIQRMTEEIVTELRKLAPNRDLNQNFEAIFAEGAGKKFGISHNQAWLKHTRPLLEAFFHAKHMLEMVCKYAQELNKPPQILPSGWATVLWAPLKTLFLPVSFPRKRESKGLNWIPAYAGMTNTGFLEVPLCLYNLR